VDGRRGLGGCGDRDSQRRNVRAARRRVARQRLAGLRALVLGGTGAIGRATARRLLADGWQVDLTGRNPAAFPVDLAEAGARFLASDRSDPEQLASAFGAGADLLVDCACFTAADATELLPFAREASSTVMISSKAVYVDAYGNHSNSPTKPNFGGPIRETQPTMAPGDGDYTTAEGYGANKVAAEQVLLDSGCPVTVLRPSKIHGPGSRSPREWVFVKRVLDRRPAVFLAHRGEGVDHTTAAANIAALIEVAARSPGARVLNSADPDAPSALEIARTVAAHLDHAWEEVLVGEDSLGRTPWDSPHPIVLDTTAALELGYEPAGDYATTVAEELDWLVSAVDERPGRDDEYFARFLDYAAEDRWLGQRQQ
jgi:nucleoside-diphosphate-sugar epimerase